MIYYLNRGDFHHLENEKYPLRAVKDFSKQSWFCIDCGCPVVKYSQRCTKCDHIKQRKVQRPNRQELKKLIRTNSFTLIANLYGVTDNTIRKWCKAENLPYRVKDIKQISDIDWENI